MLLAEIAFERAPADRDEAHVVDLVDHLARRRRAGRGSPWSPAGWPPYRSGSRRRRRRGCADLGPVRGLAADLGRVDAVAHDPAVGRIRAGSESQTAADTARWVSERPAVRRSAKRVRGAWTRPDVVLRDHYPWSTPAGQRAHRQTGPDGHERRMDVDDVEVFRPRIIRRRRIQRGSHDDRASRQRTGRHPCVSKLAARVDFSGIRYATAGSTRPGRGTGRSERGVARRLRRPIPLITHRTFRGRSIAPNALWAAITLGSILNLEGKPNLRRTESGR